MKFHIKGAVKDSGEDASIEVSAGSDTEALAIASKLHLLVESIEPLIATPTKPTAACHACGLVIPSHGVLRIVDDVWLCVGCYRDRVCNAPATALPWVPDLLVKLGIKGGYNEFEDCTTAVVSGPCPVRGVHGRHFAECKLTVRASFDGRVQGAPVDRITVVLEGMSSSADEGGPLFPKRLQNDLLLLVDGRRLSLRVAEWRKESWRSGGTNYLESLCFQVDEPLLTELRTAIEVRLRLVYHLWSGDNEAVFDLLPPLHRAIGALASVMRFRPISGDE